MTTERPSRHGAGRDAIDTALTALDQVLRGRPDEAGWRDTLERTVLALDDALVQHRDVDEGERGELARVVEKKPALVPRVEEQIQEHADLLRRAARLRGVLRAARQFESWDPERLALEARVLHDATQLHALLDSELFSEAFLQVEGGEGG